MEKDIGQSTIITGRKGERPRAVFTKCRPDNRNGEHALVIVHEGFYVIETYGDENGVVTEIYLIREINSELKAPEIKVELRNRLVNNSWDHKPLDIFKAAAAAGRQKAQEVDCTSVFYVVAALGASADPMKYRR